MYKQTQAPVARNIPPSEAEEWLQKNNYPGQRPLNEQKWKRYADLLKLGAMRPVDISFATCPDGSVYLVNGQHCLTACARSGVPMKCVVNRYKCETWEDATELFASFDTHATRTQGQILLADRAVWDNPDLASVSLRVLSNCGSALIALGAGADFEAINRVDKTQRCRCVRSRAEEVIWVNSIVAHAEHMRRVGVAAAMIATRRKRPEFANEFWTRVQSGVGFKSQHDPDRRLREYLMKSSGAYSHSRNHHSEIYSVCISWWNSAVTGTPRASVKVGAMTKAPEVK